MPAFLSRCEDAVGEAGCLRSTIRFPCTLHIGDIFDSSHRSGGHDRRRFTTVGEKTSRAGRGKCGWPEKATFLFCLFFTIDAFLSVCRLRNDEHRTTTTIPFGPIVICFCDLPVLPQVNVKLVLTYLAFVAQTFFKRRQAGPLVPNIWVSRHRRVRCR